ncbi:MAG: CoA transferase [Chloroflexi bacterium]|nr:CoA transferase [Chloroflexota bacterium]
MGQHPLDGVFVADLAMYIAGAYCSSLLADLGAEVVKVEPPHGDPFRDHGGAFQGWNRGKRSIAVDLNKAQGRDVVYSLVRRADVVVENYRPGVAHRLGVDHETLKGLNPRLVYCSITGYGGSGPYRAQPAFDPLLQAQSGAMEAQGGPDRPPVFLKVAISDYGAALLGAWGCALGLYRRARTGEGTRVETSLLNAAMAIQAAEFLLYPGRPGLGRLGDLGTDLACRLYHTSDGWMALSCATDQEWKAFVSTLAVAVPTETWWSLEAARRGDGPLGAAVEARICQHTTDEWTRALREAGVPCGPVQRSRDLASDPQALHNGLVVQHDSPDLGPIVQTGLTMRFSNTPGKVWGPAPALGQHTDDVLAELGYSVAQVSALRQARVVV